jgi:hypothetical protein
VVSIADCIARGGIVPHTSRFPVPSAGVPSPENPEIELNGDHVAVVLGSSGEKAEDRSRWWVWITAISAIGLCIRVAFIWFGARGDGPVGDQLFYSAQAIANARGDWFEQPFADGMPAADHPPLTALVLTPVTWLFEWTGSVVTVQRLFMALIGTASIIVMAVLGRFIGGRIVGIVCAGVTAVYVNVWINDGLIMAETLTFLSMAVLTLLVVRMCDAGHAHASMKVPVEMRQPLPRGLAHFAGVGLIVGCAALTRPELIALVPGTALVLVLQLRRRIVRRELLIGIAVLVTSASAVVAPWVIWNQVRFDGPVFISTNDGLTIAGANCDSTYYDDVGGWDIWCAYRTEIPEGYDAAQASALMRADGLEYWTEHLDRYPVVAAARLARVLSVGFLGASAESSTAEGRPVWLSHTGVAQYWSMLPLAVIGARRRASQLHRVVLLGTLPIVIAVALVANAYVRFRVPAEVGLIVLASLGVVSLRSEASQFVTSGLRVRRTGVWRSGRE